MLLNIVCFPFINTALYPPCAPEDMSNDRFSDAWRGPVWQINATYYGHMDIGKKM